MTQITLYTKFCKDHLQSVYDDCPYCTIESLRARVEELESELVSMHAQNRLSCVTISDLDRENEMLRYAVDKAEDGRSEDLKHAENIAQRAAYERAINALRRRHNLFVGEASLSYLATIEECITIIHEEMEKGGGE